MSARVWKTLVAAEETQHVPVLEVRREIVKVTRLVLVERIKGRVADQMVDILVLPVMEDIMEEMLVPHERVQQRTVEHVPLPQILKESVEANAVVPYERVQQGAVGHVGKRPPR